MKYFNETVEFPKDICANPLPWNTLYEYVSHTFLDGFINYAKPTLKMVLLDRYSDGETIKQEVWNQEKGAWETVEGNKEFMYDLLCVQKRRSPYHTRLSTFADDMLVLSKLERPNCHIAEEPWEGQSLYMFFWFDCDVSDCCIGRFYTSDSEEEVVAEFLRYAEERQKDFHDGYFPGGKTRIVPNDFLKGWVSF